MIAKDSLGSAGSGIFAIANDATVKQITKILKKYNHPRAEWGISQLINTKAIRLGNAIEGFDTGLGRKLNIRFYLGIEVRKDVVKAYFYKTLLGYDPAKETTGDPIKDLQDPQRFIVNLKHDYVRKNYLDKFNGDMAKLEEWYAKNRFVDVNKLMNEYVNQVSYQRLQQAGTIIADKFARFFSCRNDYLYNDNFKACFNIFAVDTLIDVNDRVYILEINTNPYLNTTPEIYNKDKIMNALLKRVIDSQESNFIPIYNKPRHIYDYHYHLKGVRHYYRYDKDAGYQEILNAFMKRDNIGRQKYFSEKEQFIDMFYAYRLSLEKLKVDIDNDDEDDEDEVDPQETPSLDSHSDAGQQPILDPEQMSNSERDSYNGEELEYTDGHRLRAERSRLHNRIYNSLGLYGDKNKLYNYLTSGISGVSEQIAQYFPKTITNITTENFEQKMKEIKFDGVSKFIAKPSRGSKGIGIKVIKTAEELRAAMTAHKKKKDSWLVSELVEPDLINGRKYHFRVYVLVFVTKESIKTYIYNDYMCYLAYLPYDPDNYSEGVMLTNLDAARRTAKS